MGSAAVSNLSKIARRTLVRGLFFSPVVMWLSACGKGDSNTPLPSVSLDTFPTGLGRGFPVGSLEGANNSTTGINPGQSAPNFRITIGDKQGLYLSDLVGRPVLINFWATWCGPCRIEMPEIIQRAAQNPDLLVLAVNVQEEKDTVAAFAGDFRMMMPVVLDEDAKIRDIYQVRGMPTSVFVGRDGKVSSYHAGVMSSSMLDDFLMPIL
jgi:thiol-disulfide isomerase/thioredoxin